MDISRCDISLQEALDNAHEGEVINLGHRVFREKVYVTKKNITLVGQGAKVVYNASHGTIIPKSMGGDGKRVFGTTGSATFTVKSGANGFKASGITFENDFVRADKPRGQAVAFKSEVCDMVLDNCRFLGEQDTLYVDEGENNIISNSYISGDIDFIFGSAECVFSNCEIVGFKHGYFMAPNTYVRYKHGFVFKNCQFKLAVGAKLYLGRPWYPSGAKMPVYPKAKFINCHFDKEIILDFIKMHDGDPDLYELVVEDSYFGDDKVNLNLSKLG